MESIVFVTLLVIAILTMLPGHLSIKIDRPKIPDQHWEKDSDGTWKFK